MSENHRLFPTPFAQTHNTNTFIAFKVYHVQLWDFWSALMVNLDKQEHKMLVLISVL